MAAAGWTGDSSAEHVDIIVPSRGWARPRWDEVWRYRELLYFLTWRDVKVRYKQTVLGVAWAVLQPLAAMLIFAIFFGRLAGLDQHTGSTAYPLYVYAGLLPWTLFATAVTNSSGSVVASARLVTKVYFPRLVIPLSAVGAALVDFACATVVLVGLMIYYRAPVGLALLVTPLFVIGIAALATGVGAIFAALTVQYRDFRYVIPFGIQLWMYITPVIYPPDLVPVRWRWILFLNPAAGLIEGFRGALLGRPLDPGLTALSLAISVLLVLAGTAYFRRAERQFADVI
jgi:lipopolysaccharide transport system permease protein